MINDAGKQAVKGRSRKVTARARPMKALAEQINELDGVEVYGRVVGVRGLMVEVAGPIHAMSVGARVVVETPAKPIPCEVVGFAGGNALLMPFAPLEGVRRGCRATVSATPGCGAAVARLARPGGQCAGRAARRQGPAAGGAVALCRSATRRRRRTPGGASARRSISGCGRSTPSSPAAAASAWAFSPAPASASRCCCR